MRYGGPGPCKEEVLTEVIDSSRRTVARAGQARPTPSGDGRARTTFRVALAASDVVAVVLGTAAGAWWAGPVPALAVGIATLLAILVSRRHAWRFVPSVLTDLPSTALIVAVPTGLVAAVLGPVLDGEPVGAVVTGLGTLALLVIARSIVFAALLRRRNAGRDQLRALVVGCDDTGVRLGQTFTHQLRYGVSVVGYVDDDRPLLADLGPKLGAVEALPELVREHGVDLVLVGFGAHSDDKVVDAVRDLGASPVEVYVVPRMYELHQLHHHNQASELIDGIPLARLRRPAYRCASWRLKRVIDVVVSGVSLLIAAPVLAVIAVAVRRETGPGIIFKQERIGLNGEPFTLFKFRSLQLAAGEGDVRWSIDTDTRLGPVGKFIRASSLDELPQLVNVLKGDMSLVGPRPERPYFVERFNETIPGYRYRHRVPVGLTGYAAVHGLRGDTSIHQRAHFDNLYAESWSLWLDLKIAVWTVRQLVPRRSPEAHLPVPAPPTMDDVDPSVDADTVRLPFIAPAPQIDSATTGNEATVVIRRSA
jgi:exopolysaccharide biosynthesis polyprenyl glycosylphosphotransferase